MEHGFCWSLKYDRKRCHFPLIKIKANDQKPSTCLKVIKANTRLTQLMLIVKNEYISLLTSLGVWIVVTLVEKWKLFTNLFFPKLIEVAKWILAKCGHNFYKHVSNLLFLLPWKHQPKYYFCFIYLVVLYIYNSCSVANANMYYTIIYLRT